MLPGTRLAEGVVVEHDPKRGVLVGREVAPDEPIPPGVAEHNVGGRRVFLAHGQCYIPASFLHPIKRANKPKGKGK